MSSVTGNKKAKNPHRQEKNYPCFTYTKKKKKNPLISTTEGNNRENASRYINTQGLSKNKQTSFLGKGMIKNEVNFGVYSMQM